MLHNVMSIFTFMGASVVRQDDSYSFEVITKTLDTVIPALIQVCVWDTKFEAFFLRETLFGVTRQNYGTKLNCPIIFFSTALVSYLCVHFPCLSVLLTIIFRR